jgi:transglutaminase-like putative cysteine protease
VGPITASVVAGHLAASVARRLRVTVGAVVASGVVGVVLATVWGQLLTSTREGFPTPSTWRTLVSRFDAAGTVIRSHPTPVPATPAVVLCVATGAGLVAVFARSIWAWQEARHDARSPRRPLLALVPTFGLFCYTALLSSQVDRAPGTFVYLVSALAFVIAADRSINGARSRSGAGSGARRLAVGIMATLPAVLGATLAVVVPLAASSGLSTLKVNALPFVQPGGPAGAQGLDLANGGGPGVGGLGGSGSGPGFTGVRAIDLVDNLKAVIVNRTTEVMFSAKTTVPTYWQLAVLTQFDGTAWLPDPTTEAAAQSIALPPPSKPVAGLPALPEPQPTKTFQATVTIGDLQSTLLPLPPTTVSVSADADVVPGFGVVQAIEAPTGFSYSALARDPVDPNPTATLRTKKSSRSATPTGAGSTRAGSTNGGSASAGSAGVATSDLAPYLQLPTLPAQVVQLAHQIVASADGPAAEAAALARWFNSGRYRYTLSPPATTGSNALESFLFTTKAGFCQQFAAAYAVLARVDNLPTRVAVGFTTGAAQGQGRYRITGEDAHVWPEVYLGPSTGWTSYEPTPSSLGEPNGIGVNSGSRSSTQNPGAKSTASTASTVTPNHHLFSQSVSVPSTVPLALRGKAATVATQHRSGWSFGVLVAVGAVVLVALAVLAGMWARRAAWRGRRPLRLLTGRRRRRRLADPTAEVLAQWRDAESVLEGARLGRQPAETIQEHAARLKSLAGAKWLVPFSPVTAGPTIETTIDAYDKLAALAARASYASDPCSAEEAAAAEALGVAVRSGLARPARRSRVPVPS